MAAQKMTGALVFDERTDRYDIGLHENHAGVKFP